MALDLSKVEEDARRAVAAFWRSRSKAAKNQRKRGTIDAGTRGMVTAGKNLHGFLTLIRDLVRRNGLPDFELITNRNGLTLPGYFRATKNWDVLILHRGQLVAALEFKSQVGSIGNNQNNRSEEAIGNGTDFRTAFRERAFRDSPPPFLGYLLLLEDSPTVHRAPKLASPNFPVFPEFARATYAQRYDLLCRRLVAEGLYSAATLLVSDAKGGRKGGYCELSEETSLRRFASLLAAQVSAAAAMKK